MNYMHSCFPPIRNECLHSINTWWLLFLASEIMSSIQSWMFYFCWLQVTVCMTVGRYRSPKLMLCLPFISDCFRLTRWFTSPRIREVTRVTRQQGRGENQRGLRGNNCGMLTHMQSPVIHLSCVCEFAQGYGDELCLWVWPGLQPSCLELTLYLLQVIFTG